MGRPLNADATATWGRIRSAAVRLLVKHGFEAMNLRQLAAASELQPGSLYHYFSGKSQLLSMIIRDILETALVDLQNTVRPVQESRAKLAKFIEFHVLWHTARREEPIIAFMELRNLSDADYKICVRLRERYEGILTDVLVKGAKEGKFVLAEPRLTAFAVLGMLTSSYAWYKKGGRLSPVELAEFYKGLIFAMLQADTKTIPSKSAKLLNSTNVHQENIVRRSKRKSRS